MLRIGKEIKRLRSMIGKNRYPNNGSERNRAKGIQFSLPVVISLLSLTVSVMSAYFSSIRQTDDLQLLIANNVPDVKEHIPLDGYKMEIARPPFNLTFINLGTRSAAVTEAALVIIQPGKDLKREPNCDDMSALELAFDFKPFAIEPNRTSIQTTVFHPPSEYQGKVVGSGTDARFVFEMDGVNLANALDDKTDAYSAMVCFRATAIAAGKAIFFSAPLYRSKFTRQQSGKFYPLPRETLYDENSTLPIIRQTGTVFDR